MNIIPIPSSNFTAGRRKFQPEAIVIHIMEGTLAGTDSWFGNRISNVSAHYGIGKNGEVHQYVQETDTAWHAGRVNNPSWSGMKRTTSGMYINPNLYTIGIEHEGNENTEWTDSTYAASSAMIKDIAMRWKIPMDRVHVIGHHEIYSLKTCPGNKVDLNKLISLASGISFQGMVTPHPPKYLLAGKLTTSLHLNIRSGPDRTVAPFTTIEPGVQLACDGYTDQGESINGNSKWYYTNEGKWFWSGGTI